MEELSLWRQMAVEDSLAFDVLCWRCLRCYRRGLDEGARYRSLEFKKTGGTHLGVASLRIVLKTQVYHESES